MTTMLQRVETWLAAEGKAVASKVEADLEAGWQEVKPAAIALGQTVLTQCETAAAAYVAGLLGGPAVAFSDAVASVVAQLPGDVKQIESVIAGVIAAHVGAKAATAPAA